jgi:formate dehydrogenase assembly factor FdhD
MTTATDTDLQSVKDLITAGNAATQKQITDLAIQIVKLEQRAEVEALCTPHFTESMNRGFLYSERQVRASQFD